MPHALAIVLLLAGQAWLAGHVGTVAFGSGEVMILAATLLWSVEVVYVKRLLAVLPPRTLAVARMGIGTTLLVGWVALSGKAGQFSRLDAEQWRWIVLTGILLTAYVATWYAALARAQAIDVTSVLVFGAFVTALLSGAADGRRSACPERSSSPRASCSWPSSHSGVRSQNGRSVSGTAGPLLFARYAYPPNALGLCGADSPRTCSSTGMQRPPTPGSPSSRAHSTAPGRISR